MACHWHLWDCCHLGNLKGVKRELAKGADVNGKKDCWQNDWIEHADIPCLTAAVWSKRDDIVSLLLSQPGIEVDATDYMDFTALHHACSLGYREKVRKLLASGANVNCRNDLGDTPLNFAVQNGHKEVVSLLMGVPGLDIEIKGFQNKVPLHYACYNGKVDIARMLLTCGANVNSRERSGKTPLMLAFEAEGNEDLTTGNEDVIFLLLEHPAIDVNARDSKGMSALHCAMEAVREHHSIDEAYGDCVQFLAEKAHVDLDAKDNRGRSIMQTAR